MKYWLLLVIPAVFAFLIVFLETRPSSEPQTQFVSIPVTSTSVPVPTWTPVPIATLKPRATSTSVPVSFNNVSEDNYDVNVFFIGPDLYSHSLYDMHVFVDPGIVPKDLSFVLDGKECCKEMWLAPVGGTVLLYNPNPIKGLPTMVEAILSKSGRQHRTRCKLYEDMFLCKFDYT